MRDRLVIFCVLVRDQWRSEPKVYKEALTAPGARELARTLAIMGHKSSVVRIDIRATELASLRFGRSTIAVTRCKA